MEKLSKEYVIQKVEEHKDLIKDATDRLSETLYTFHKQYPKDIELNEEFSLEVRKILHEIVAEVSMIGGFCDNWTRDYLDKTVNIMAGIIAPREISYFNSFAIELWAMRVNAIMIDYNKTPFRLSELKPLLDILGKAIKSIGK